MKQIYTLDRYTNKNFLISNVPDEVVAKLRHWDKVVYDSPDQMGTSKLSVGTFLGHEIQTDRQGTFRKILVWDEKKYFEEQQASALGIFPLFPSLWQQGIIFMEIRSISTSILRKDMSLLILWKSLDKNLVKISSYFR